MEYRPPRGIGTLVGGALAGWCLVVTLALSLRGALANVSTGVVGLYVLAACFFAAGLVFAYWTYCCHTLRYFIDRNGLTIFWGDLRQTVPMSSIERLVPGRELASPAVRGLSWPGHHVGRADVKGLGDTLVYSTNSSPHQLLYVVTPAQSYALSIDDEVAFARDLQAAQRLGSLIAVPQAVARTSLAAHPFWRDRWAQLLGLAAIVAFFVLLGYVYNEYAGLPERLALSFPYAGGVTRVAHRDEVLALPSTAVGLLLVNLALGFVAHAWERSLGYVLLVTAVAAQGMMLAGAIIALN